MAILLLAILITVHEFGHFLAARAMKIEVREFSIGMGPALLKKQGKETPYSLRLIPIGGYCAMEGEDEDTGDPKAFSVQRRLKKFVILVAGAFSNFLLGFVIILLLVLPVYNSFAVPVIAGWIALPL